MLKLQKAAVFVSALLIVLVAVLMNVETFVRYVFGTSTRIAGEYTGYLFCAATMIGFYPALMKARLLRITFLLSRLRSGARAIWELAIAFVSAAFCLVVAYECWGLFETSWRFGTVSQAYSATPLMYPQFILPVGFAVLALGMLVRGVRIARELSHGKSGTLEGENDVLE